MEFYDECTDFKLFNELIDEVEKSDYKNDVSYILKTAKFYKLDNLV